MKISWITDTQSREADEIQEKAYSGTNAYKKIQGGNTMVDIVIGAIQPTGPPVNKPGTTAGAIEAEILNIREPRQNISGPTGKERRKQFRQDPVNGRVLTVLVPNGTILPKNLDRQKYKVLLRFIKK